MYRGDILQFRLLNLKTLLYGTYTFTINTYQYVTSTLDVNSVHESDGSFSIDSYTNLAVDLLDVSGDTSASFTVRAASDFTGQADLIEFTWTLNNELSLDDYWIYISLPKANVMYQNEIDTLLVECIGTNSIEGEDEACEGTLAGRDFYQGDF